jgi:hypothetical protein
VGFLWVTVVEQKMKKIAKFEIWRFQQNKKPVLASYLKPESRKWLCGYLYWCSLSHKPFRHACPHTTQPLYIFKAFTAVAIEEGQFKL